MRRPVVYLVIRRRGGSWDFSRPMDQQPEWDAHAALMDQMVRDGVIVLGGPITGDREAVLVMRARDEAHVHELLAPDPWTVNGLLETSSVREWTIRLGSLAN